MDAGWKGCIAMTDQLFASRWVKPTLHIRPSVGIGCVHVHVRAVAQNLGVRGGSDLELFAPLDGVEGESLSPVWKLRDSFCDAMMPGKKNTSSRWTSIFVPALWLWSMGESFAVCVTT